MLTYADLLTKLRMSMDGLRLGSRRGMGARTTKGAPRLVQGQFGAVDLRMAGEISATPRPGVARRPWRGEIAGAPTTMNAASRPMAASGVAMMMVMVRPRRAVDRFVGNGGERQLASAERQYREQDGETGGQAHGTLVNQSTAA